MKEGGRGELGGTEGRVGGGGRGGGGQTVMKAV